MRHRGISGITCICELTKTLTKSRASHDLTKTPPISEPYEVTHLGYEIAPGAISRPARDLTRDRDTGDQTAISHALAIS